jgi:hypothetical protein
MESGMIVKTRRRNAGFIDTLAERMATHPRIVSVFEQASQTMRAALQSEGRLVLRELLREMAQGEQLRVYVGKIDEEQRDARQGRIEAAIRSGEAPMIIAKREGVSERHVRRMRGRLGPARTD